MFPDSENCYGRINPGDNLRIVAVRLRLRDWNASIEELPSDDDRLYIESEVFKLRSASSDSGEHILDGVFDTEGKGGESGIAKLSDDLQELGIPHHFELYDDSGNMCREFKFKGC